MKKLYITIILLGLAIASKGQKTDETPKVEEGKLIKKEALPYGFIIGINSSELYNGYDLNSLGLKYSELGYTGTHWGIYYDVKKFTRHPIFIRAELKHTQKGASTSASDRKIDIIEGFNRTYRFNYLEMPLYMGYGFTLPITRKYHPLIKVMGGPYISYATSQSVSTKEYTQIVELNTSTIEKETGTFKSGRITEFNYIDLGVSFQVQTTISNRLSIGVTYSQGLSPLSKESNLVAYARNSRKLIYTLGDATTDYIGYWKENMTSYRSEKIRTVYLSLYITPFHNAWVKGIPCPDVSPAIN